LPYNFIAPDAVLDELLIPYCWNVEGLGLKRGWLDGSGISLVVELGEKYPRAGSIDLMALVMAKLDGCLLLTGDGALRSAALSERVDVHGTLWLMDRLVELNIISRPEGANSIQLMIESGRWLPREEVAARIKAWGDSGRSGLEDRHYPDSEY